MAAEKVPTRLNPHVLVPLGADLAQLEGGVHGLVELQLLLGGKWVGVGWGGVGGRKVPGICASLKTEPSPRLRWGWGMVGGVFA